MMTNSPPNVTIPDAEDIAKEWVTGLTSVASLVTISGKVMVFEAMPDGSPTPVITLSRAGGAPALKDVPYDQARISFSIYAKKRPQAKAILAALLGEIESLKWTGPEDVASGRLEEATTLNVVWLPDPVSDTPRYILDALIITRSI